MLDLFLFISLGFEPLAEVAKFADSVDQNLFDVSLKPFFGFFSGFDSSTVFQVGEWSGQEPGVLDDAFEFVESNQNFYGKVSANKILCLLGVCLKPFYCLIATCLSEFCVDHEFAKECQFTGPLVPFNDMIPTVIETFCCFVLVSVFLVFGCKQSESPACQSEKSSGKCFPFFSVEVAAVNRAYEKRETDNSCQGNAVQKFTEFVQLGHLSVLQSVELLGCFSDRSSYPKGVA